AQHPSLPELRDVAISIEFRLDRGRGIPVAGGAGADHPKMIQEGAAKRCMKEMIRQCKSLGIVPELCLASVVEAHGRRASVGIGGELVHPSAVDLLDLVIVAVKQVAGCHADRNESVDVKRLVWQIVRKTRIDLGDFTAVGVLYEPLDTR